MTVIIQWKEKWDWHNTEGGINLINYMTIVWSIQELVSFSFLVCTDDKTKSLQSAEQK